MSLRVIVCGTMFLTMVIVPEIAVVQTPAFGPLTVQVVVLPSVP
jgi:hypothetical protein